MVGDLVAEIDEEERIEAFDGCAIVPCVNGVAAAPETVNAEPDSTVKLFRLWPDLRFADIRRLRRVAPQLEQLLWGLHPFEVVDVLHRVHGTGELDDLIAKSDIREVLRWISRSEVGLAPAHRARLSALPVFPSAGGWRALDDLQLPGSFDKDPLGIAETVDLTDIEGLREFFGDDCLGAQTLSLDVYVRDRLIPAFDENSKFSARALDELLLTLSENRRMSRSPWIFVTAGPV